MSILMLLFFNLILINLGIVSGIPTSYKWRNLKRDVQNTNNGIANNEEVELNDIAEDDKRNDERAESSNNSNPLSGLQQLLTNSLGNGNMILGSYQALLMPMPQGQDAISGLGNLFQGFQNLFQG